MKYLKRFAATAGVLSWSACLLAQSPAAPNGVIDNLEEMVERRTYMARMKDGVRLATDVYRPVLQDALAFSGLKIQLPIVGAVTAPTLKLANRGVQYMLYPNQADPRKLPIMLTRTPYGKNTPAQGQIEAILGYAGVLQDTRGRYESEGVYLPVYSDGWDKTAYLGNKGHSLDITPDHEGNTHEDGVQTLDYLLYGLRFDANGDSIIQDNEPLLSNGSIGTFGASAHAITQYQLAAARKVNTDEPGLKCMVPIVASCEFYNTICTPNGVYRERMIDGWLRGQIERYDEYKPDSLDGSVYNGVQSLSDYGTGLHFPKEAAEKAIDFWTLLDHAHYPYNANRAALDVSRAPLNAQGKADPNGTVSRYTNMELPGYHLSGWWDIFADGQLHTWQNLRRDLKKHRGKQKLVIGPWAHYTIGSRSTGDMRLTPDGKDYRYPDNVNKILGAALDDLEVDNLGGLASSEAIRWYRSFLGAPTVTLPRLDEWQEIGNVFGNSLAIKVPADTFRVGFEEFFNFINGTGPLNNLPVSVKGIPFLDENTVIPITIPATGQSLLGDASGIVLQPLPPVEWDGDKPGGVPNVRFYVPGPVGDPENAHVGNYWVNADTFPLPNLAREKIYFHADGSLNNRAPGGYEGALSYFADPDNPIITHGGPNMIEKTPEIPGVETRESMGQMNLADPLYTAFTNERAKIEINGDSLSDILHFVSSELMDTFSVAGVPTATIYARSVPQSTLAADSTNCDFIVRVADVYPDGREMYVFEGAVNARAREYARSIADGAENINAPWSNIKSGALYEYRFSTLPIAYTFGKGHKIKILISSSNYPRYQACPNIPLEDGEFFRRRPYEDKSYRYHGLDLYPRKALQTIEISDEAAGNIEFQRLSGPLSVGRDKAKPIPTPHLTIYPNPAEDVVTFAVDKTGRYELTIFNDLGQSISQAVFQQSYTADVSRLSAGLYHARITDLNGKPVGIKKLMIK